MNHESLPILTIVPKGRQLRSTYIDALSESHLRPVVLDAGTPYLQWTTIYQHVFGILLLGGNDLDPELYGETRLPTTDIPDRERSLIEIQLVRRAFDEQKPLLGICLGAQTIAVALGGSLNQAISGHQVNPPTYDALNMHQHAVTLLPGSLLHTAYGTQSLVVNSMHHQSIRTVPPNILKATAFAPDNTFEGIEAINHHFMVGTQFHAEADPALWGIFSLFSQAISAYKTSVTV